MTRAEIKTIVVNAPRGGDFPRHKHLPAQPGSPAASVSKVPQYA